MLHVMTIETFKREIAAAVKAYDKLRGVPGKDAGGF